MELIKLLSNPVRVPVLALTGTADLSADHTRLAAFEGMPHVAVCAPEGVNHMLRQVDDDNSMLTVQKQYLRLSSHPIDERVRAALCDWAQQLIAQ